MIAGLCLFTDSLEPSGVGEHILTLAAELQGRYRISFVCPPSPAGRPFLERARGMGLETLPLKVRGAPKARETLRDWLGSRRVQVFHGHAGIGWEGHAGIYAARDAGIPIVVRTEHLPYVLKAVWRRADHFRLINEVDRLICVSEEACATFVRAGIAADKLTTIRNGISLSDVPAQGRRVRAQLGLSESSRMVLTVARMTKQKGHSYLAEAIAQIADRAPNAYFVWAGKGPMERRLHQRVHELGLDSRVLFIGERNDVPELLAASDLFVLPSLFEGLPLVVLEAMAAGLPVVGTRVCGTAEVVRDQVTGRLVEAADAGRLASAMLQALEHPHLAAQWGTAGRLRVQREFSAAQMAGETMAIYEDLLRQGRLAQPAEGKSIRRLLRETDGRVLPEPAPSISSGQQAGAS